MLRSIVSVGMNIVGMFIVFAAMLVPAASQNLQLQVILVLIGVLLMQGAIWKFANPFLPSERRFDELRNEVDDFIDLVRDLNETATTARKNPQGSFTSGEQVERVLSEMHLSVDQMGRLAGREISFAYLPEPLESITLSTHTTPPPVQPGQVANPAQERTPKERTP